MIPREAINPYPERKNISLEVIDLSVDDLCQAEPQVVSERVINSLIPKFDPYKFPILVWEDQRGTFRVVDGFHRLFTARKLGISEVRCQIGDYTEAEFWEQRLAFTREHEKIAGHRMVAWAMSLWSEVPIADKVDAYRLFNTMSAVDSAAMISAETTLRRYGLSRQEVEVAIQFAQRYRDMIGISYALISGYITDINIIGKDNLYVLGLDGITSTKLRLVEKAFLDGIFGQTGRTFIIEALKVISQKKLNRWDTENLIQGLRQTRSIDEWRRVVTADEPLGVLNALKVERELEEQRKRMLEEPQKSSDSDSERETPVSSVVKPTTPLPFKPTSGYHPPTFEPKPPPVLSIRPDKSILVTPTPTPGSSTEDTGVGVTPISVSNEKQYTKEEIEKAESEMKRELDRVITILEASSGNFIKLKPAREYPFIAERVDRILEVLGKYLDIEVRELPKRVRMLEQLRQTDSEKIVKLLHRVQELTDALTYNR